MTHPEKEDVVAQTSLFHARLKRPALLPVPHQVKPRVGNSLDELSQNIDGKSHVLLLYQAPDAPEGHRIADSKLAPLRRPLRFIQEIGRQLDAVLQQHVAPPLDHFLGKQPRRGQVRAGNVIRCHARDPLAVPPLPAELRFGGFAAAVVRMDDALGDTSQFRHHEHLNPRRGVGLQMRGVVAPRPHHLAGVEQLEELERESLAACAPGIVDGEDAAPACHDSLKVVGVSLRDGLVDQYIEDDPVRSNALRQVDEHLGGTVDGKTLLYLENAYRNPVGAFDFPHGFPLLSRFPFSYVVPQTFSTLGTTPTTPSRTSPAAFFRLCRGLVRLSP